MAAVFQQRISSATTLMIVEIGLMNQSTAVSDIYVHLSVVREYKDQTVTACVTVLTLDLSPSTCSGKTLGQTAFPGWPLISKLSIICPWHLDVMPDCRLLRMNWRGQSAMPQGPPVPPSCDVSSIGCRCIKGSTTGCHCWRTRQDLQALLRTWRLYWKVTGWLEHCNLLIITYSLHLSCH